MNISQVDDADVARAIGKLFSILPEKPHVLLRDSICETLYELYAIGYENGYECGYADCQSAYKELDKIDFDAMDGEYVENPKDNNAPF